MRKHGWQLPYHPLQVVAVSVFLALGFAFYVFFAPFLGKKMHQYILMGIYTPLIICVFGLYFWCAAADPADARLFKSTKYFNTYYVTKEGSKHESESTPSIQDLNFGSKSASKDRMSTETGTKYYKSSSLPSCLVAILAFIPCALMSHCASPDEDSSQLQTTEHGMFYCSLCEVEVYNNSKHCRVCDKCVDRFDHHCRWLNNCIGKKNYKKFFALMVSALLLLILQWSTGIVVLIRLAIDHKKFTAHIASKLGSSFTLPPYVIVVVVCIILAIIATLPLIQLFFFHVLLIKKGISTYDYIIALREQEHQGLGGPQSPQMSPASSITGFSSVSSFHTFRQGAWCTPPHLFVEDQYDVIQPDTSSVSSVGRKTIDDPIKKKNTTAVKISPWSLARLNANDISIAAAEARKKSKILQPVSRKELGSNRIERDMSFGRSDCWMSTSRLDDNQSQGSKRIYVPEIKYSSNNENDIVPLQHESESLFRAIDSSPESSLDSPDIKPFKVFSREDEGGNTNLAVHSGLEKLEKMGNLSLTRSMSDGYDASGGEDSDRVPSRLVQRSGNMSARLFVADQDDRIARLKLSS